MLYKVLTMLLYYYYNLKKYHIKLSRFNHLKPSSLANGQIQKSLTLITLKLEPLLVTKAPHPNTLLQEAVIFTRPFL